jgi:four helix bundle protein
MAYESHFDSDNIERYNAARRLRKKTYQLIKQLPPEEKYCLRTQMRRAAISVSNNIAEGHGRWHYLENIHFCQTARGSVGELINDYNACLDENYGPTGLPDELKNDARQLVARINSHIAHLRRSKQGGNDKAS